ncbi:hypothetical protein RND81_14G140800 [Saponaria officinalis]|uniref:ATP-dependent DNA helicase n=1 Tax=Saponaria officinalis TaxID=3572 RepID=A0AAW1GMA3_SAPOF
MGNHFCCGDGQIKLQANEYPLELVRLYTSLEEYAVHFQKYAWLYNNLFAFSSIRGCIDSKTQKGIYVFKLHGQIYQIIPDLIPNDAQPKYLKLYFYDGQHEAENRLNYFLELHQNVIEKLIEISQANLYDKFFRSLREVQVHENVKIAINRNTILDQRVYNTPTSDEVVVIWSEDSSSSSSSALHILVIGKSNESHRIMHYYGCYDPLQYPLLFPRGECGWSQGFPRVAKGHREVENSCLVRMPLDSAQDAEGLLNEEARCSAEARLSGDRHVSCREYYCYMLQIRPNNYMLRAGCCLQQYVVDMYVKVENTRLDFFRKNQDTIRAELYQGILDTLESGENCAANIRRRVILPPTFLGGPRDMKKRYLNAMSLVQKYGKPDLFITMTCNSSWPEIKEQLVAGEKAQNRPNLVSRRGLPHAHFLIILKTEFKMKCPGDYDKFISVEILSEAEVQLGKSMLRHMMHSPCGLLNPENPCMKHSSNVERCKLNNGWVIPYNPYLLALFDCHIKVEVCSTIQAVKYLYKIFGFDLFEMHLPVMPLPIHLPNIQSIRVRPHEKLDRIVSSQQRTRTPLTEFFRTNKVNGGGQTLYGDFTELYRWDTSLKTWLRRKNKLIMVGRLAFVAPAEGERYFLRLLLLHVRGPQSFEHLMMVDGCKCATFQEVVLKLRLLEEVDAVELCLKEASEVQMPFAVRRLFATVLVFCQPSNPLNLWTDYYSHLSEDFARKNPNHPDKTRCLTVRAVEHYLEAMGKTLKFDDELQRTRDIADALDAPIPPECEAFDKIIDHVRNKIPGAFFVDGPREVRLMGRIVLPTATSGIAAANIASGRTAHSRFKIPIDLETSLSSLIREAGLLIWDEASMARRENIESLENLLRDLCNPKLPFGGKILSVVPRKSLKDAVGASLFPLALGDGELQREEEEYAEVPSNIMTSMLFRELEAGNFSSETFTTQAILTPMNEDKFPGKAVHYRSFDVMLDDNCNIYPTEFINKLCPGGMSPHDLVLKENYYIIVTGHHKGEHVFIPRIKPRSSSSNGQLYVALSRARKSTQVSVLAGILKTADA